jgi:D-arabinose 1-dehydrogenase-like Zn-dependent alcohol dehydrogenase
LGRAALVGLTADALSVLPYPELINKEVEVIGVSDHLATELPLLMKFVKSGKLYFPPGTLRFIDLDAGQINAALDELENSTEHIRTVIRLTGDE